MKGSYRILLKKEITLPMNQEPSGLWAYTSIHIVKEYVKNTG
jgi:hypothetical protein